VQEEEDPSGETEKNRTFGEMDGTTRKRSVAESEGREYQVERNGEQYEMALKTENED